MPSLQDAALGWLESEEEFCLWDLGVLDGRRYLMVITKQKNQKPIHGSVTVRLRMTEGRQLSSVPSGSKVLTAWPQIIETPPSFPSAHRL